MTLLAISHLHMNQNHVTQLLHCVDTGTLGRGHFHIVYCKTCKIVAYRSQEFVLGRGNKRAQIERPPSGVQGRAPATNNFGVY